MSTTAMPGKLVLLATVAVGGLAFQPGAARAQDTTARAGAPAELEAIVVTARKREESFLTVPVTAAVVTGQTLTATKVDSLSALATRIPTLVLGSSINSTGAQLSMRGVGTMALNATIDQSVLLDVDGMPMSQSLAYGVAAFDLANAEVFKGPQSLFFGKNSTAGVISLRSADPIDRFEAIARLGYETEAKQKQVDLIVSGPVTDSLKLRLATRFDKQDGFFHNHAVATPGLGALTPSYTKLAPSKNWIVRGTALFQPNDAFTARLKVNFADNTTQAGSPLDVGFCPTGTGPVAPTNIGFLTGNECKLNRTLLIPWFDPAAFPGGLLNNGTPYSKTIQRFGTLDLSYQLGDGLLLSSVTGYYNNHFKTLQPGSTTSTTQVISTVVFFRNRQFTQEVRLASSWRGPVNFTVGGFFQDGVMNNDVFVGGNARLNLPPVVQHPVFKVDNRLYSVFGQLTWDITPKLELAGGARWTHEKRSMTETNLGPGQGPIGPVGRPDPSIRSSNISPEVTLTYKATDQVTAYAAYKTGHKSGSYNTLSFVAASSSASFGDEDAKGGEIGLKTSTPDQRLRAAIAAYYYRYNGLQVGALQLSRQQNGIVVPFSATLNAARAISKGVDFDMAYAPEAIPGLTLNAAVSYNRARYSSFPNAPCGNGQTISEGCDQFFNPVTGRYTAQNLKGHPLVRAPEWTGYLGLQDVTPVGDDMRLTVGGGVNFSSSYQTVVPDLPGFRQRSYAKWDANIALAGREDRWEVALIGRNLTNRITTGWCANSNLRNSIFGGQIAGSTTSGAAGPDQSACSVDRGRELWARLTLKY
jgi:iron complex outermembrane receptor protein